MENLEGTEPTCACGGKEFRAYMQIPAAIHLSPPEVTLEIDWIDRRAQADMVAAWCDKYDYSEGKPARVTHGQGMTAVSQAKPEPTWLYYLRNASDVPVYDVMIDFKLGEFSLGTDTVDVLPPGDGPVSRNVPTQVRTAARDAAREHADVERPFLIFRDAAGRAWRRTSAGRLARFRLQGEPPPDID